MRKSNKVLSILLVFAMVLVLAACGNNSNTAGSNNNKQDENTQSKEAPAKDAKSDWVSNVSLLTGGEAGTYFPLGVAMGNIITDHVDGVTATGLASGASVVNITEVNDGQAELALVQNDVAFYAQAGDVVFDEVHDKFSGVATLYPEVIQIVARADSGIVNIADLVGKRVAVGDAGSGTEANSNQILEIHGITYNDITVEYMSFGDAATALQDSNIDAAFVTGGIPTGAIQQLASSTDITIVNLDSAKIDELMNKYPYYTKFQLSADTYNTAQDSTTVAVQAMIIARSDLPDDQVYEMTKAIFENLQVLKDTHARGHDITVDTALDGMSIPLHPGAKRYFDEQK